MIREFAPLDISQINVQPKQVHYKSHLSKVALVGSLGWAFTYLEDDKPKAAIGMIEQWKGRAIVWALIGDVSRWPTFHKSVLRIMNDHMSQHDILRLEMTTESGFVESERWAKMLGFELESVMRHFGVDGKDHKMWVKLCQQQ